MKNNREIKFFLGCAFGTLLLYLGLASSAYAQDVNQIEVHPGTYKPIVKLWTRQMASSGVSGKVWIGPISGNGTVDKMHYGKRRHTIIYVPSQYDSSKPTQMLMWLHGHNGFNKFGIRILRHINERYRRGDNIIVVAVEQPWSHWTKTRTRRNGTGPFRKPGEFEEWMPQVLSILERYKVPVQKIMSSNITLYGHSAGGSGIKSMALSGALQVLQPGTIVFSDSTYGRWFDVVYDKYIKHNLNTKVFVLTKKWQAPYMSMTRFLKSRKNVTSNVRHIALSRGWTHKRIGDNCLLYPGSPFSP